MNVWMLLKACALGTIIRREGWRETEEDGVELCKEEIQSQIQLSTNLDNDVGSMLKYWWQRRFLNKRNCLYVM